MVEDESLAKSEDSEELRKAIESMSTMLRDLKELESVNNYRRDHEEDVKINNDIKIKNLVSHETLNLQLSSATFGVPDDDRLKEETEMVVFDDQILAIFESNDKPTGNLEDQEIDLDQFLDFDQLIDFEGLIDGDY
ncbi:hypothetical protein AtEden1_Chr4g0289781 [Arabidopsis thaliana]